MKSRHWLLVLLGFPGMAAAGHGDAKPDEAEIRRHFERSLALAGETLRMREEKRKEFLDLGRLGLGGDSCLAYAGETGDCSISATEFNRRLVSHVPDSLEFQSGESLARQARAARQSVFEQLLDRAFLAAYRPEDALPFPAPGTSNPRAGIRAFPDAYDLPTWLRAFPGIRAQVVAASDSAWLADQFADPASAVLPATLPAWQLPDSAAALLARIPPREWTPVLRVPFGFLACAWLDSLPSPEALAKIPPRLAASGPGSVAGAPTPPDGRRDACRDEDTLGVSLRLSPPLRRSARDPGPAWSASHSAALPASVKARLRTAFRQGARDTLGPIRNEYGVWTMVPAAGSLRPGKTRAAAACRARAEAERRRERDAGRIRSEWETLVAKPEADPTGDVRTALLERLSGQGDKPDAAYRELRRDWASRSLRFTRDLGFLEAPPGPE